MSSSAFSSCETDESPGHFSPSSDSSGPKPASKLEQVVKKLQSERLSSLSCGESSHGDQSPMHTPEPEDLSSGGSTVQTRLPVLVPNPLAKPQPLPANAVPSFFTGPNRPMPSFPNIGSNLPYPGAGGRPNFNLANRPGGNLTMKNLIALQYGATLGPNRMSYPREFKLMVVKYYYENGMNKYRTCKTFQITKSMLNGWLAKLDKIEKSRPGSLKSGNSGRKPQFPQIEQQLYEKYTDSVAQGNQVGNKWLRDTAKAMACNIGLQFGADETNDSTTTPPTSCQFSERWLANFKRRYNIVIPYSSGSKPASPTSPVAQSPDSSLTLPPSGGTQSPSSVIRHSPTKYRSDQPYPMPLSTPKPFVPMEPGRRGRKVQFPQVESVLYDLYLKKQGAGERISNRWLQDEARRLAVQICPEVFMDAYRSARCMFSEHWLHNFKKRYGISLKNQIYSGAANNGGVPATHNPGITVVHDPPEQVPLPKNSNPQTTPSNTMFPAISPSELYKHAIALQYLNSAATHGGQLAHLSALHLLQQVAAANQMAAMNASKNAAFLVSAPPTGIPGLSRKTSADAEPDSTETSDDVTNLDPISDTKDQDANHSPNIEIDDIESAMDYTTTATKKSITQES